MTRSIFTVSTTDCVLVGTRHLPRIGLAERAHVGLLMVNAGPAPRAGNGDLSARLCDRCADSGVPGFRIDFQGLGDSSGKSWAAIEEYWIASQGGTNDVQLMTVIEHICIENGLERLYVGGLCAGAICAVRIAAKQSDRVAGLVLFEPDFRDVAIVTGCARMGDSVASTRNHRIVRRLKRMQDFDHVLARVASRSDAHFLLKPVARLAHRWIARRSARRLPADAHLDSITAWMRSIELHQRTLVVLAGGAENDMYFERVLRAVDLQEPGLVERVAIPRANHLLTSDGAIERAIDAVMTWMQSTARSSLVRTNSH
jgi:pimeloyl-ACP methyl ester carboxylesterase